MTTLFSSIRQGCTRAWTWRGFVFASVARELRARYARSLFGWAWLLLPPLVLIAIYTLVFSRMMRGAGVPDLGPYSYSVFLCAGMLTWQWFSELLSRVVGLFTQHATLIKKTAVPLPALLAADLLVTSFGLAVQLALFALLLLALGLWPGWQALLFLPLLFTQGLLAVGLGLGLSVLHVFFRDVGMGLSLVLQVWFWITPIVYPATAIPAGFQDLLAWNFLTPLIQAYQAVITQAVPSIDWRGVAWVLVLALLALAGSLQLMRRNRTLIRDEI